MAELDLRRPDHLPNLRLDRRARHPSWLPRQRRGTTPQMIGRYPEFDVFDARGSWDPATARLIEERMRIKAGDPLRFFSGAEADTARVLCDTCLAQDDEPRIPVLEMIDQRLAAGELDGYQYDGMPDDRDTWRLVLAGMDGTAARDHGVSSLADCSAHDVEAIVARFADGKLYGGCWDELDVGRAWSVCSRMIVTAFYAHPWAWNEIGFGGPAYPRGFMRMGPVGYREPFETAGATGEDPATQADRGDA